MSTTAPSVGATAAISHELPAAVPLFSEDAVLQWPVLCLADVVKPLLLSHAAERLPTKIYESPRQFASLQSALLALEVHAQLTQSLEWLADASAPNSSLRAIQGLVLHRKDKGEGALIEIRVHLEETDPLASEDRAETRPTAKPVFKPKDLLLLSQRPLVSSAWQRQPGGKYCVPGLERLKESGSMSEHCLAIIEGIADNGNSTLLAIRARVMVVWVWNESEGVSRPAGGGHRTLSTQLLWENRDDPTDEERFQGRKWYLTPLLSLVTEMRVADALAGLAELDPNLPAMATRVLTKPPINNDVITAAAASDETAGADNSQEFCRTLKVAEEYLASRHFNNSQQRAVMEALQCAVQIATSVSSAFNNYRGDQCNKASRRHVQRTTTLIQGPPGTGKTTALAALLISLFESNIPGVTVSSQDQAHESALRILACAPTNVALGEVGRRLLDQVNREQRLSDYCRHRSSGTRTIRPPGVIGSCSAACRRTRILELSEILLVAGSPSSADGPSDGTAAGKLQKLLEPISLRPRMNRLVEALGADGFVYRLSQFRMTLISLSDEYANKEGSDDRMTNQGCRFLELMMIKERLSAEVNKLESLATILLVDAPRRLFKKPMQAKAALAMFQVAARRMLDTEVLSYGAVQDCQAPAHHKINDDLPWWWQHDQLISEEMKDALCQLINSIDPTVSACETILQTGNCGRLDEERNLEATVLQCSSLVLCTVAMSGGAVMKAAGEFSTCVVDEAAQLVEAHTAVLLHRCPELSQLVLVGDHMQLPATVISEEAKRRGYGVSTFERLVGCDVRLEMLDIQYRMHPAISCFPSAHFYDGRIRDGENVQNPSRQPSFLSVTRDGAHGPFRFIDLPGSSELQYEGSSSICNEHEAWAATSLVRTIRKTMGGRGLAIGCISPYKLQVSKIQECLKLARLSKGVEAGTVDGFQGREMDIVIFSCARSNSNGSIGFLSEYRRLNVAITRGKYAVWVLGNVKTLQASGNEHWAALLRSAGERGLMLNGMEDAEIQKNLAMVIVSNASPHQVVARLLANKLADSTWKVKVTGRFWAAFKKCPSQPGHLVSHLRHAVMDLIQRIADGQMWMGDSTGRKPKNCPYPDLCEREGVFTAKTAGGGPAHVLVYCVDVDHATHKQVVVLHSLMPLGQAQMEKEVAIIRAWRSSYSHEYLERCRAIKVCGERRQPVEWDPTSSFVWCITREQARRIQETERAAEAAIARERMDEDMDAERASQARRLFVLDPDMASLLANAHEDDNLEVPFELAPDQQDFVKSSGSKMAIGRSGTGKTTAIFKIVYDRMLSSLRLEGRQPRQLVLTASRHLAAALKRHCSALKATAEQATAQQAPSDSQCPSDEPPRRAHQPQDRQPAMLDDYGVRAALAGLPPKLSDLEDSHFPLVLSFDMLLGMMDNQLRDPSSASPADVSRRVDAGVFTCRYWPHMNEKARSKAGSAAIVWSEIAATIKGSLEAVKSPGGRLGPDAYLALAEGRHGKGIEKEQRAEIYKLFQQYEKMKVSNGAWDFADVVGRVSRGWAAAGGHKLLPRSKQIEFVYVDEVQDCSMGLLHLLSNLCTDFECGYVLVGDTAQAIAQGGSAFQFDAVRDVWFNEFVPKKKPPKVYQMVQNFRTHQEVVDLAHHATISVLLHWFPASLDKLSREHSEFRGELPVLLSPGAGNKDILSIMRTSSQRTCSMPTTTEGDRITGQQTEKEDLNSTTIQFGADQAILVYNEAEQKRAQDIMGDGILVLTVEQCKGLEFEDVLIYNLVSDSRFSSWRVLYSYLQELWGLSVPHGPSFDRHKHHQLMADLKILYVAITRAKVRLLWYERDWEDRMGPFSLLLTTLGLVDEMPLSERAVKMMHRNSSPEEWREQGRKLFGSQQYRQACTCFKRSGDKLLADWASACFSQAQAKSEAAGGYGDPSRSFREAAELFRAAEKYPQAAECFERAGEYLQAGKVYRDLLRPPDWDAAARCFERAGEYLQAGKVYRDLFLPPDWDAAARCFELGGDWAASQDAHNNRACRVGRKTTAGLRCMERALACRLRLGTPSCEKESLEAMDGLLQEWTDEGLKVPPAAAEVKDELLYTIALRRHRAGSRAAVMEVLMLLARSSLARCRRFLSSRGYHDELIEVEETLGSSEAVAQAYLRKLDVRAAAAKFDQAGLPLQAAEQLLDLAIAEAFWGRRGASLSTPTFDGAVSEDLNAALERLDSSAFPSFSNSHWGLRARCQALLIFLPAAATGGEHAPAARPLHRQMDDLWQTIESSRAARCNVILQAIAGPLAIRDLTMRLQALLGPPTAPPDHVADVLSALQGWIGRLSLSTAKLRYVLEAATKGQQPHLVEESELLDGCSALFGLAARPGSPMFLARPAALALLSSIGKDARFPWKNALSLMADGTQGVALADAAPLVLQELDAHVLQAVKVAEKAIENVLSALSVDEAWEGPQANTRPSPWAGICCHAAILQTPLVTLSARCEKNKQSRAASESLWRILMPLMWTAQDPSPLLQLLPRQRIPLSVSLGAALEELLRQDLYKQRPRAINPAWTLRNSIALLMSLPYADSTLLLGRLKQEVLPVAEAKYVPLVPAQVPEPATDDPSEDLAAYRIFQAIHCLQQCLASSPASSREADGETLSGQDEAPPLSRLRKLQFDTAWWMIGALHATFQVPHWLSCPGYPYPLHMLEAAEKAALVCCGVMKGWHKVLVPRRMAMQHLQPLEPLLSWSVSANILPKEKRTLEGKLGEIAEVAGGIVNEEPVSLGKWARMDTRTRKLRAAGPALITARAAVLLLIVASNTALNDVRNNAVLSLARIVEQPRDAFEDLASRHISQHMEQSTRMVSRSGTWRALGSLCSDLGDQLVGLVRPGEDCKELQRHSIPAVEVAWGPGHHLGLQSLDPSLGSPDTDNGAVRPPMAQPCPVEDETDQEDGKEGGGEVSVAGKVSFDKERELEETAAAWARRFGTRLGSWLGSARQMLQPHLPAEKREQILARRMLRAMGLLRHHILAQKYLQEVCHVQVEAAALQNDLRLLTSRKPSPMSAGTNAAGCSYKASRGSRFIPGDWASWQGLKSSGLSGSDDLLDDVVDIQENLNRAMLELSPRKIPWDQDGALDKMSKAISEAREVVGQGRRMLQGLGGS